MSSPHLEITPLVEGQAAAEVTVNTAIKRLEALQNFVLAGIDATTPPGSPAAGDAYHIGAAATGVWTGKDGKIAVYNEGWMYFTPVNGFMAVKLAGGRAIYVWESGAPVSWVTGP